MLLPREYTVPGSERSGAFDVSVFRMAESEVAARRNCLIAYSHMQVRAFMDIVRQSKLADRKTEIIFMMRDVLPHRVSFFHEMIGPEAHGHDQADLDAGKTVARPYVNFATHFEGALTRSRIAVGLGGFRYEHVSSSIISSYICIVIAIGGPNLASNPGYTH